MKIQQIVEDASDDLRKEINNELKQIVHYLNSIRYYADADNVEVIEIFLRRAKKYEDEFIRLMFEYQNEEAFAQLMAKYDELREKLKSGIWEEAQGE